jgi:hypothetical protein
MNSSNNNNKKLTECNIERWSESFSERLEKYEEASRSSLGASIFSAAHILSKFACEM